MQQSRRATPPCPSSTEGLQRRVCVHSPTRWLWGNHFQECDHCFSTDFVSLCACSLLCVVLVLSSRLLSRASCTFCVVVRVCSLVSLLMHRLSRTLQLLCVCVCVHRFTHVHLFVLMICMHTCASVWVVYTTSGLFRRRGGTKRRLLSGHVRGADTLVITSQWGLCNENLRAWYQCIYNGRTIVL